jgi:hypothetical protein
MANRQLSNAAGGGGPAQASDAAPKGVLPTPGTRRPGEAVFAVFFVTLSLVLLWQAYGISGLSKLSGPGTVPTAVTAVMVVSAAAVLWQTIRKPTDRGETVRRDVLPGTVLLMAGLLATYGALLVPLGFLPTSALFLVAAIKLLSGRGWGFTLAVALGSLLAIYLIFRIVFTVLMPPGIVPEGQMLQWVRDLMAGVR